jgi:hypothetical protein
VLSFEIDTIVAFLHEQLVPSSVIGTLPSLSAALSFDLCMVSPSHLAITVAAIESFHLAGSGKIVARQNFDGP